MSSVNLLWYTSLQMSTVSTAHNANEERRNGLTIMEEGKHPLLVEPDLVDLALPCCFDLRQTTLQCVPACVTLILSSYLDKYRIPLSYKYSMT